MDTIKIKSSLYNYSVTFVDDFSKQIKDYLEKTVYVIDKNVFKIYKEKFMDIKPERIYVMDAVESKKNMETVMDIIMFFKNSGVKKDWKVICFGGGITQDVTTIASNLYLRNIDWYFFPTTLLSMSDSCIGGKCGINLGKFKNQIGVFYPPKKIFIDVNFLNSSTEIDYINGWGEILKFSLTSDPSFYDELKKVETYIPCKDIARFIHKGLFVKKTIIEEDEFESDLRRVLNYGHTFGHALEAYTDNRIPHGAAVIWGIDVVNRIAMEIGLIKEDYYLDIKRLIKKSFLKEEIVIDRPHDLFEIIKTDKKVKDNVINLALLNSPSHLIIHPMNMDDRLEDIFNKYLEETHAYYCN